MAKGHSSGIVSSSDAGACGLVGNFWHPTQRRTMSAASRRAVEGFSGQRSAAGMVAVGSRLDVEEYDLAVLR